jgi:hypothetical protein
VVDLNLPIVQSAGESSPSSRGRNPRDHILPFSRQSFLLLLLSLSSSPLLDDCQSLLDSLFLPVKVDEVVISSLIVLLAKQGLVVVMKYQVLMFAFLSILNSCI